MTLTAAMLLSLAGGPAASEPVLVPTRPVLFLYEVVPADPETMSEAEAARQSLVESLLPDALHRAAVAGGLELMTRKDLTTLVEADSQFRGLSECTDESCFMSFEGISTLRFFVSATFISAGDGLRLSLRAFDRKRRRLAYRETELLPRVPKAAEQALGKLVRRVVGAVVDLLAEEAEADEVPWIAGFSPLGRAGLVMAGVGAATLLAGTGVGIAAIDRAGQVEVRADGRFGPQGVAADAHQLGWAANGLWIAGAVLAGAGVLAAWLEYQDPVLTVVGTETGAAVIFGGSF